jgi:alpha-glucosidase
MQWSNAANGGFCPAGVQPWLPVNPNYSQGVNVADQTDASDSLLSFYRRMLRVRKQTPALVVGDYVPLHEEADDYVAFLRTTNGLDLTGIQRQTCLVVLNTSDQTHTLDMNLEAAKARRVFSSHERQAETDDLSRLAIAPYEIYIGQLV